MLCGTTCAPTGLPTWSCWAWAAAVWPRRCCARRSAPAPGSRSCSCSIPPIPRPCSRSRRRLDLAHTLFIVASKSGGTIETLSQFKYFFAKVESARRRAGRISLHRHHRSWYHAGEAGRGSRVPGHLPESARHWWTLLGPLLLWAGAGGDDRRRYRHAARPGRCHALRLPSRGGVGRNPGLWLGTVIGTLAQEGRDKVTLVMSPPIAPLATGWSS